MAVKKRPTGQRGAKKKAVKKKAIKTKGPAAKNTACKPARKEPLRATAPPRTIPPKKTPVIEPGPPTVSAPPVEEPAVVEEAVGIVTHYYSHLGVAVVQLNKGVLRAGDRIHVAGHTTDFMQAVGSLEYEHQQVERAEAGQCVGLKVFDHAREHDIVYLVK